MRRLGDVLLTTPLIRSLRRAWPDARIDALVFADTAGILAGNPDLDAIVDHAGAPSAAQSLALAARLWNRYALAVSTQSGDRPTFFACDRRPAPGRSGGRAAQRLDQAAAAAAQRRRFRRACIASRKCCGLPIALGIARVAELVCPAGRAVEDVPAGDYAVIHAAPMFRYKQWTVAGWRALAAALAARGLTVIASGGPAEAERRYLDAVWEGVPVSRLDGRLDWPQLTGLLAKARVYIGPDTSVTHLAAAAGCPTVALYGPTDPPLWGPWPVGGLESMWEAAGSHTAAWQCLAGAERIALYALSARGLRTPVGQRQPMPGRTAVATGHCRRRPGAGHLRGAGVLTAIAGRARSGAAAGRPGGSPQRGRPPVPAATASAAPWWRARSGRH